MSSFFFRANYALMGKYMVNFTGRRDGASQLATEHKWANFFSYGAAWRLNQENFMQPLTFISDLKLRFAYGVSGNASIDPYTTAADLDDYLQYEFGEPDQEQVALAYRSAYNFPDVTMTWERTGQYNLGLDFGLFKNRIFGNIDVFTSYTTNMLLPEALPETSGYLNTLTNAGKTKTQGLEIYLSSINIDNSILRWKTTFTFGTSFNEIVELASGITDDSGSDWYVGQPINVWRDMYQTGIIQLSDTAYIEQYGGTFGEIKVRDSNKDGSLTPEDEVLYYRSPEWTGNFENVLTVKGFELAFSIYARMGHTIRAGAYSFDPRIYDTNIMDNPYWTPVNPNNEYPSLIAGSDAEVPYESVIQFRNGSFAKLKHVTLAYTVPTNITNQLSVSKLRAYISFKNPAILYSKIDKSLDPERNGSTSWPLARLTVIGVNVEF